MKSKEIQEIESIVKKEYELAGKPEIDNYHLREAKELVNYIDGKYKLACNSIVYHILRELSKVEHPDRVDWDKIDMLLCPVNDWADFYYPDGTLICRTNNDIEFNYIRTQIKKMRSTGFYIIFRGERIDIDKYGNLSDYPNDFFENYTKLLLDLI